MGFPPLAAYGVVGNDDRVALIDRDGSVDWCCFPHLESPSVFARVLDREVGGHFTVRPTGPYDAEHGYVEGTNVLRTTFETDGGRAVLTDLMPVVDDAEDRPERYQEAIYRRLHCRSGRVEFEVSFAPRFDYARAKTTVEPTDDGVVARGDGERMHLHGDEEFRIDADGGATTARATVSLSDGETAWFDAQYGHDWTLSADGRETLLEETVGYWHGWLDGCQGADTALFEGPWGDDVARSALTLKLLIHESTGAIPAAATTSIPEVIGGERNWDYRFNWIRDAKFTVQALYNIGQEEAAHDYFEWFLDIASEDPAAIQPVYGLHGDRDITEVPLEHLSGYRDSRPVRVGNAAAGQQQHDIYGTIVQGIYETVRHDRDPTPDTWALIRDIATHACRVWDEPDDGIWEFRREPRHYLHSKLLAWVSLDRSLALQSEYGFDAPVDRWERERAALREAIEERGYSESVGAFVQHFDTDEAIDATALLVPLYGFLPVDDQRVQSTIDAVLERLTTEEGLVARFVDTDVRRDEHEAFVLCSFWLVDVLVLSNRLAEAEEIFTNVLDRTTPLGLLSEKLDTETGEHLGNFPQAFSHIGLLNSAIYLGKARAHDAEMELEPEEFREAGIDTLFQRTFSDRQ